MSSADDAKDLFAEISKLHTEQRNKNSMDIDVRSTSEILKIINERRQNSSSRSREGTPIH